MNKSESIKELAAAMSKAQGEIKGALKDQNNPFFKSKYADLGSVVEAIRAPLTKYGLSYVQLTEPSEKEEVRVETVILHASGEWISSTLALPVSKGDAQGFGSALTYARRYGLSAAFGVAPEDDDGNAATKARPGMPTGAITPTTGARSSLDPERKAAADAIVKSVRDWISANSIPDAAAALDNAELDADQAVYLWTFFDSKERSALKKEADARRKAALQREEATQA